MYFLDNVFPLQYPMYRPSALEGGRGWLLSLLLRTKPLYHASLGLSAYHRGVVLLEAQRNGCRAVNVVQQEKHLAICLKEFREDIENVGKLLKIQTCPKNALGFMACVVQLVFFEVFLSDLPMSIYLLNIEIAFCRPWQYMADTSQCRNRYALSRLLGSIGFIRVCRIPRHNFTP